MADLKISELDYLAVVADTDLVIVVDVSDTSETASGKTKKSLKSQLKGDKGDQGIQGIQGVKGDTGNTGATGATGAKGDAATVDAGSTTTGTPGSSASVVNVGTTDDAVFNFTIPRGDVGAAGATGATGAAGTNGSNGTSYVWKGTYSGVTTYVVNDTVYYNGSSYICILDSTGNLPTNGTYWNLIAQKGDAGTGTVTSVAALTIGTTGTDITSTVANSTTTPVITLQIPTASASNRGALSSADWSTFNGKQNTITNPVTGTGTTNEISYWASSSSIGTLPVATYPSLTELSYVKGVTSAVQSQLNGKQASGSYATGTGTANGTNTGDNAANSSTTYIGTTAVALNRASAALVLTGITSIDGTASNLSGTPALPNGTTATTQAANDNSTKIATTAYVNAIRTVKSGTFASGSTTYIMTDATVTAASIIDVYAQATPVGSWSVVSAAGSFTITSTATETSNVAFKYFINNF